MSRNESNPLKQSFLALFFLCVTYIAVFSLSALTRAWWFGCLLEVAAVVFALLLNRFSYTCQGAPKDYDITWKPNTPSWVACLFLPLFVGAVMLLSLGTNALGEWVGYNGTHDYGDNLWLSLLTSALLPAITEEVFCRYLFLPRLTVYSRSGAILASALFFSLLHGNFVQIPYAFFAGLCLGTLAVVCKSIFPCILFHACNNAASILLHFFAHTLLPTILLYVLLGTALVCGVLVVVFRRKILTALNCLVAKDERLLTPARGVVGHMFTSPLVFLLILFVIEACLRF